MIYKILLLIIVATLAAVRNKLVAFLERKFNGKTTVNNEIIHCYLILEPVNPAARRKI